MAATNGDPETHVAACFQTAPGDVTKAHAQWQDEGVSLTTLIQQSGHNGLGVLGWNGGEMQARQRQERVAHDMGTLCQVVFPPDQADKTPLFPQTCASPRAGADPLVD